VIRPRHSLVSRRRGPVHHAVVTPIVIDIHVTDVTGNGLFVTPISGFLVDERLYTRRWDSMSADRCQACALSPESRTRASE
jgi:hypothetical protein